MAPTPSSKFNFSTPTAKPNAFHIQSKTPQSKHRLNFPTMPEHPVEVVGRIRDHPEQKNKPNSALQINEDGKTVRLKMEIGYRDFTLDGVSMSEEDDLEGFYTKFVESRINGVKLGQKCTIMMYGPTGSGKSHTMFGCSKQPGIVYNSLKGILGEQDGERLMGLGTFVQVTVLEIYNEEIYDLLSSGNNGNGGGFNLGLPKGGSASKVRLEVMGKKAKNATFISGNEAGKIMKEIQKVEKRRIVKSTLCNERSSRSHCVIILDVPTVGGRLMLVDMAGSENIEQAGQNGFEAKMQTAKINQGNIALKRVVESIANGDSHVPFRDSKLTMLLQDSFEDDESKILMILCASPDPKELHKTIATLEYGAKAKCIVRGSHTPTKHEGMEDPASAVVLGPRIAALEQFICKLQTENKQREKEREDTWRKIKQKEEEAALLRQRLARVEASEKIINAKVNERAVMLESELERKVRECQRVANEIVETERQKIDERMSRQQQEAAMLRQRLEEIEALLKDKEGGSFMKKLLEACSEDSDFVKSMELDTSIDLEMSQGRKAESNATAAASLGFSYPNSISEEEIHGLPNLSTVYEEEENEMQEVIEEKRMIVPAATSIQNPESFKDTKEIETPEVAAASRQLIIQNIFTLCGNYRELSQGNNTPVPAGKRSDSNDSMNDALKTHRDHAIEQDLGKSRNCDKVAKSLENHDLLEENSDDIVVYVQWEALKENPGKLITTLKVSKNSTLADLRKLIEIHLGGDQRGFTFLDLQDPCGAPLSKEKEAATQASKLPVFNNQEYCRVACLRAVKLVHQRPIHQPFSPLENKLVPATPKSCLTKKGSDCFSPEMPQHLSSTPFITVRRR